MFADTFHTLPPTLPLFRTLLLIHAIYSDPYQSHAKRIIPLKPMERIKIDPRMKTADSKCLLELRLMTHTNFINL